MGSADRGEGPTERDEKPGSKRERYGREERVSLYANLALETSGDLLQSRYSHRSYPPFIPRCLAVSVDEFLNGNFIPKLWLSATGGGGRDIPSCDDNI